ncbi:Ger(x)C family spore germination protein [Heyndrickxia sp. NPDC080065]|uniref:Ger(x)C family spore germination protein n=1 Tax=Heyndrickxia sp. NPDC080065 TaxID=3390568 RepID=UPI003D01D1F9
MKKKLVTLWLLIIVSLTLLTGCWDKNELTDISLVNAMGVDKTEDGKFLITLQIINPGNVAGSQAGGGGGGGGGIPVTVYSSSGENMVDAARRSSKEISRKVYYAHANLIVIGEDFAREGIYKIFDSFERDPQFRTTAVVVIAENARAEDMLKMITPIDKIPANKITKALKFTEQALGENLKVNIDQVVSDFVSSGKMPVISGFKMEGNFEKGKGQENTQTTEAAMRLQAGGLAIFKDGKLKNWIYGKTARGVTFILNKIKQTTIDINWKGNKNAISLEVTRGKTSVRTKMENDKPVIIIHTETEGDIGETEVPVDLKDPKTIHLLEVAATKEIKKEIESTVKKIQKEKSDVFGFGDIIHRSNPKAWKKLERNWNDVGFPALEVRVKVDTYIRRTGLRNKSYMSEIGTK